MSGDHGISACSTGGPFDGRFDSPFEIRETFPAGAQLLACPCNTPSDVPTPCPYHQTMQWFGVPGVQVIAAPRLHPDDVDRIARRVVELLKAAG